MADELEAKFMEMVKQVSEVERARNRSFKILTLKVLMSINKLKCSAKGIV